MAPPKVLDHQALNASLGKASSAIIELLEFAYFADIEEDPRERGVRIKVEAGNWDRDDEEAWFRVKVHLVPAGDAYTEIKPNIMQGFFAHMTKIVMSNEESSPERNQLWDKLFEDGSCKFREWRVTPPALVSITAKENTVAAVGWLISFKVYLDVHEMKNEYVKLLAYLQKFRVTNPGMNVVAILKINGYYDSETNFKPSDFYVRFKDRMLEATLEAYMSVDEIREHSINPNDTIKPKLSKSYKMNTTQHPAIQQNLKVSCAAWLHPTPANEYMSLNPPISKLKVLFIGPGDMPIAAPPSELHNLAYLFDLRDYGMTVGDELQKLDFEVFDCLYSVNSTETVDSVREEDAEDSDKSHCLMIVIFFSGLWQPDRIPVCNNLEFLLRIRHAFPLMCSKYRNRIRKAVGSVLDKIFHNYRAKNERQSILENSIPIIHDALTSIVKRSTRENFRNECFQAFGVEDSQTFQTKALDLMWEIASNAHGVRRPQELDTASQQRSRSQGGRKRGVDRNATSSQREESQQGGDSSQQMQVDESQVLTNPVPAGESQGNETQDKHPESESVTHQPESVINQPGVVINICPSDRRDQLPKASDNIDCEDAFATLQFVEDLPSDGHNNPAPPPDDKQAPAKEPVTPPNVPSKQPVMRRSPEPNWYSDLLTEF